jgi:signal transduction histidine kinase
LDTARIESNTLKIDKKEAVNLNEVISDIMKYYRKRHHQQQQQQKKIMASSPNSNNNNNYQTKLLFKLIQHVEEGVQEDILVQADKERITQVISNILDNAYKFSEQGGEILITLEKKDKEKYNEKGNNNHNNKKGRKSLEYQYSQETQGEAIITIKDTGTGIDPKILPRLFSKFASKSDKGTGLGLYISKYIVEAHGGRMWAKNNSDGKGATFTFTLPLKQ